MLVFSIPLFYPNHRQNTVDDTMYEHIGLCFFVLRWLRCCGVHISLRRFRSVSCYDFSSVPRGFYVVFAKGYESVVQKKHPNRKFFPLTATCRVMYLSLTTANISCPQVVLWTSTSPFDSGVTRGLRSVPTHDVVDPVSTLSYTDLAHFPYFAVRSAHFYLFGAYVFFCSSTFPCTTSRKVAGSICDGVIGIFH